MVVELSLFPTCREGAFLLYIVICYYLLSHNHNFVYPNAIGFYYKWNNMKQYHQLMQRILDEGVEKSDRTGTGTLSVFGHQLRFNMAEGFPVLTTKKLHLRSIIHELLWFLKGAPPIDYLTAIRVKICDELADENGELGPVYGYQWRSWPAPDGSHIDQISQAVEMIKSNPDSRRIIVSAWNVGEIKNMALPPCHAFFQFYVADGKLSCQLYQRSADVALGVPFNIASYALLMTMIAQECNLTPGIFVHTLGDAHIYLNHVDGLKQQLERTPKALPQVHIAEKPVLDIAFDDIELLNYEHDAFIKFPIAV